MAKIFWIAEKDGDTMEMFAFNNKRKAQEKAMELAPHFSFGDTEIPKEEDNDSGDQWLYSGTINAKDCFVLYREGGMPNADGEFVDDEEAKRWVEAEGSDSAGACFPVKLKGGMGSVYMSSATEGNGTELWIWENGEVYESKQIKTTMKYIPTFESFVNEYSTIVETTKMLKALKKAVKKADSFEEIGEELEDLDYKKEYRWELVKDGSYPVYVITYLAGTRHGIADPKFWENSADIEETIGDVAIGWILTK
jgi:hypothetical protein